MTKIPIYQVDAFAQKVFTGNPAAVCLLDNWISDDLMQSIAAENNLAETAFVYQNGDVYEIRWFTPTIEVDLCGHATLAAASVIFGLLDNTIQQLSFHSPRSGQLNVSKSADLFYLDFPVDQLQLLDFDKHSEVADSIGQEVLELYKGKTDLVAVVKDENTVNNLQIDLVKISQLPARGLIVTAEGDDMDFVSRFFAPQSGIDEDPVTGSAHTSLIPLWSRKLNKSKLTAQQISERAGKLNCQLKDDRCLIGGQTKLYLEGVIYI